MHREVVVAHFLNRIHPLVRCVDRVLQVIRPVGLHSDTGDVSKAMEPPHLGVNEPYS